MYSSAQLMGGLGNQMFQIAHAYTQALKAQQAGFSVTAKFDLHVVWLEQFPERQAVNYSSNILQRVDFTHLTAEEALPHNWLQLHEAGFGYSEITPTWEKSVKFHGYFQSEKYFGAYRQEVVELFSPPENTKAELLLEFPQLKGNTAAVFVRRGDYLKYPDIHPPTTEEYLRQAIEINSGTNPENYLIVSDDYAWCRDVLSQYLPKDKLLYANVPDWKQLWTASLCRSFICANSTFGWWSAYLSNYTEKQVIFPAKWFGPNGLQTWQDIYPVNGIII